MGQGHGSPSSPLTRPFLGAAGEAGGWLKTVEPPSTLPGVMPSHSPPGKDLPWSSSTAGTDFGTSSGQEELFWPFNATPMSCSYREQIASSANPEDTELQEQMGPRYTDKTRWDKLCQIVPASAAPHDHPTCTAKKLVGDLSPQRHGEVNSSYPHYFVSHLLLRQCSEHTPRRSHAWKGFSSLKHSRLPTEVVLAHSLEVFQDQTGSILEL